MSAINEIIEYAEYFRALLDANKKYTDSQNKKYYTKEEVDDKIREAGTVDMSNYYTKSDVDTGYLAAIDEFRIQNNLM